MKYNIAHVKNTAVSTHYKGKHQLNLKLHEYTLAASLLTTLEHLTFGNSGIMGEIPCALTNYDTIPKAQLFGTKLLIGDIDRCPQPSCSCNIMQIQSGWALDDLRLIVDGIMAHYNKIFNTKVDRLNVFRKAYA
ncbi:hypothetical protein ACJX0J_023539 [Zea mays]